MSLYEEEINKLINERIDNIRLFCTPKFKVLFWWESVIRTFSLPS